MRGRVVSLDELVRLVAGFRRNKESVALANGCFDLLHVGHIRYLQGAKLEADHLVVAVNDDPSVTEIKGAGRPILPVSARAELVSALLVVDAVVIFSGLTVNDVLRAIRPNVHCKGTDYTVETVPERETVLAYGGRTAIVGDPKGHSTRDLLARIKQGVDEID
ncbi:MAG: adenylyltransferase/cytidyltransferase family protein [Pseudomonadales bacterium]|nr:adenylyltransferase/cytidyltransferase family protein [Pseudomonadales bacterium]